MGKRMKNLRLELTLWIIMVVGLVSCAGTPVSAPREAPSTGRLGSLSYASDGIISSSLTDGGDAPGLETWTDLGIRFEGPWRREELALTLDVLDAFGRMLGEARFAELSRVAVIDRSSGRRQHLTLIRKPRRGLPAAVWYDRRGQIVLNDSLFDAEFVRENYRWSFLNGPYTHSPHETAMQSLLIGHELGHVLIDGLHAEARSAGYGEFSLERVYRETVPPHQWPHDGYVANENLATELALWALGLGRTNDVYAFRVSTLIPVVQGRAWASQVAREVARAGMQR